MKDLDVNSEIFKSVIEVIKESQEYHNQSYRDELEEVIQILTVNNPSQLVLKLGERHFPLIKKFTGFRARRLYYDILQKHSHYEFALRSHPLQQIAKIVK